ncbi:hypothetical protein KBD71_04690 [Candidatus Woesebacteria bacterium]|nr:hypothetical protein [Candidatus Woesebacteria bacterium]
MALIEIQVPEAYEMSVVREIEAVLNRQLTGHNVKVEQVQSLEEFIVLIYANVGLTDGFLRTLSRPIEIALNSSDFSLQVTSEKVVNPAHYTNGSWRM